MTRKRDKKRPLKQESDEVILRLHRKLTARSIADDYTEEEDQLLQYIKQIMELRGLKPNN